MFSVAFRTYSKIKFIYSISKLNDFESDKKLFSGDLKEKERELSVLVPYMRVADLIIQKN